MTHFTDLGLIQPLLDALTTEGYTEPTPIQAQAIPHLLTGRDLIGIAQTGTGKTAAFALPILQHLAANPKRAEPNSCRVLVLSPTRELASQIAESFLAYGRKLKPSVAVVFGGVGHRPQAQALARGIDVLVATPGRLIDHLQSSRFNLSRTEIFVLDEADRMLDMGFIQPLRQIARGLPAKRQSLFFSATMPKEIRGLAAEFVREPVEVSVTPPASTSERVAQRVMFVETARKRDLLAQVLKSEPTGRTLIFTRTKHGADRVVRQLGQDGIPSVAIHGNKSQSQREKALDGFRSGRTPILVATDIAARGIDVDGVTHVINFDLPNIAESYVHRIGRTARAGAEGIAISFCDGEERAYLRDIEKLTRQAIPAADHRLGGGGAAVEAAPAAPAADEAGRSAGRGRGRGRQERQPRQGEQRPANGGGGRNQPRQAEQRAGNGGGRNQPRGEGRKQPRGEGRKEPHAEAPRRSEGRGERPAVAGNGAGPDLTRLSFLQPQRRPQATGQTH